ncbi:MAG: pentapeptide repeat-containing protein [Marinilabiliaceae bacterium]|nr:pentapeptide repeat-containing protein [Marinilabiliaceae bacterium]
MYRFVFLIVTSFVFLTCKGTEKKEINASSIISELKKGNHIHYHDKIIVDDLNFSTVSEPFLMSAAAFQQEIKSNIFFSDCIFLGKVSSNGKKDKMSIKSRFNNNVIFINCDFRDEVDFSEAIFYGLLNFSKSKFSENATFDAMTVWSKDAYFSEMKAEKRFSMVYSLFADNLYFISASFADRVSFQETTVNGKFMCNNCIFKNRAEFDLMKINGKAFFNYAAFEDRANFLGIRKLEEIDFINTKFKHDPIFE